MFGIALKSLLGHKLRILLTVFSIIIGVSFVAGSYIFTDSMSSTFDSVFEDAFSSVDVTVRPVKPEFGESTVNVPVEVLDELKTIKSIDKIEPEVGGTAQIIKEDGSLVGGSGAPTIGFSWTKAPELNSLKIKDGDGRPPEKAGEVVIDLNTAETHGISVGDKISIQTELPVEEFTVVGLASFGEANTLAGATISAFEFSESQRLFNIGDAYSQISMKAVSGVSADQLKLEVEQVLDDGYEAVTGEQQENENLELINEGLGFITTALLAFAGISIFVGSFIIQNTFRIIVSQRSKELALLRSVGATRSQVVKLVVYEAFIVSVVASAIGIVVGVGISNALRSIGNAVGLGLPIGKLALEPRTIYVSMAVGVIVTVLSALMPAIKASRVSPVEGMRDTDASGPRKSLRNRTIGGLIVTALGSAVLLYGLFSDVANPIILVGGGAGVMFIGISIIAPILSSPLANIIGYPVALRYGLVGRIAKGNTKRTPRRTASTAAALMIGVSLVVLVSIFASSIKATVDQVIKGSFPGDITISSKLVQTDPVGATFPASVANDVEALPQVEQVSRLKYDFVKLRDNVTLIVAIEPNTFNDAIYLKPNNPYTDLKIDTVYVNESTLEADNLAIGDTIDWEYSSTGPSSLRITGSFEDAFDSPYLISAETYRKHFNNDKDLLVVANLAEGVDPAEGKNAIDNVLSKYPVVQAQDKGELIIEAKKQIDQILALMSALLGFAVIIAVLGITNTLTLSVSERTREIGMLRAVGMTRSQIRRMIRAEAIIIAVFGALLGVVMGTFFGWAILRALEETGLTVFSVPTSQIVVYIVLSAFAGMFAAILPSIKASKMNILDAINYQ